MKKTISAILILAMVFTMVFSFTGIGFAADKTEIRQAYEATAEYLLENDDPELAWYLNLWSALPLKLSGLLTEADEQAFRDWAEAYVVEKEGKLTTTYTPLPDGGMSEKDNGQYTEFSKMVILCCEFGMDPRNIGGYDIVEPLAHISKISRQGINGPIWAMMALDRAGYDFTETAPDLVTEEVLINYMLNNQLADGGWAFTGTKADPDITGMAVVALSAHKDDSKVKEALNRAVECMKAMELSDGGFATVMETGAEPTSTSESDAQIIAALCLLGIDPFEDDSFIKKGSSPIDDLMSYYTNNGTFRHVKSNSKSNYLATCQAFYALAHYYKYIVKTTQQEEIDETLAAHSYVLKISKLRSYIAELKSVIDEYISSVDTYKEQAEKYKEEADQYKAEAQKYKITAQKNGIKATNINLSVSKVTVSGSKVAKLTFSKSGSYGIDSFKIYRSTKADSGFTVLVTKKSTVKTYKDTKVKKGKTYYYKVRGVKKVDGTTVYTQCSPVISITF